MALGLGVALAEQGKKGKGKQGEGGKARQAQRAGGGLGGGKKAKAGRHGLSDTRQLNSGRRGAKAARRGQRSLAEGEQGDVPAVQKRAARAGGGKAQIRQFDLANARRDHIKSVTFNERHRIVGAEHWHGERYVVFRNYHPIWHDHVWWHAHYPRIVLIGGGWYYWNAGFWYPAWGYDPGATFYAYDGPIYAYNDLPPDQVVANVQQALQDQGYYQGEVDGMLGPLTRAALAQYQADHGLYTTSAIDEPTMSSLGFS